MWHLPNKQSILLVLTTLSKKNESIRIQKEQVREKEQKKRSNFARPVDNDGSLHAVQLHENHTSSTDLSVECTAQKEHEQVKMEFYRRFYFSIPINLEFYFTITC